MKNASLKPPLRILHLEDNARDAELIRDRLEAEGLDCEITLVNGRQAFESALEQTAFDLILCDYKLPDYDGGAALAQARAKQPGVPVIIVSGSLGEEAAVDCLKHGATDYLLKQWIERLPAAVKRALDEAEEHRQRQHAEAAMIASEVRYRRLFETAKDGILILNAETGRIVDVNPFLTELLGYAHETFVGKHLWELGVFKDIAANAAHLKELQAKDYIRYDDRPLKTSAGRRINVEFVSNAYNVDGCRVMQCNIRDITERKKAEESHAQLATAVEQAVETIEITDLQGTILYANPAFAKTTGYTVAEAIGQNPRILKSGKQDAEFYRRMWEVLTRGETWSGHFINKRKDGALYEEDATISPVRDAAGTIVNYVSVKRDVTLQMQFEARLRQAQKMESIGQLAGGIAHDFNNILSCIIGYMYLAKIAAADHPAILANLEHISKASDRAIDLVGQILTFSRQNKPEREPVELNRVVLEALKLLRASVPATIRIQTELTETPAVLANVTAIHQVIMNLGTNAMHAMRDQPGTLKVEMGVLEVDEDFCKTHPDLHPGRYVKLSVSDTGCGMDLATMEHIFEPFYTTKAVGEGTGLGLAVVHGIMKTHDGGISVDSQPGAGTTFHLYFPVLEITAVTPKTEAATPILRGQGERILFVDDEEVLAGLGQQILEGLGYRVTKTSSVLAAIALVRASAEPFDLVITDLAMPVMDGVKLGEQLLQLQPHLRIILTTGFSGFMTAEKVRELGFCELLSKPSTARTLGETVQRVLHPAPGVG
jgi:PAS domain S-box-containing protein